MPILCLDFDGVGHEYPTGWQGATVIDGQPVDGFIPFLREAVKHFTVVIYSSRSGQEGGIGAMQTWLQRYLQGDDRKVYDAIIWPTTKPAAFLTLDDRAKQFMGVWPTIEELKSFKTWQGK
jgi:hypothetical protein